MYTLTVAKSWLMDKVVEQNVPTKGRKKEREEIDRDTTGQHKVRIFGCEGSVGRFLPIITPPLSTLYGVYT